MSKKINIVMAEFIEMKYSDKRSFNNGEWTHSVKSLSKFETNWNWIIPVYEKASEVTRGDLENKELSNLWAKVDGFFINTELKPLYTSLYEFITYHNSLKPSMSDTIEFLGIQGKFDVSEVVRFIEDTDFRNQFEGMDIKGEWQDSNGHHDFYSVYCKRGGDTENIIEFEIAERGIHLVIRDYDG